MYIEKFLDSLIGETFWIEPEKFVNSKRIFFSFTDLNILNENSTKVQFSFLSYFSVRKRDILWFFFFSYQFNFYSFTPIWNSSFLKSPRCNQQRSAVLFSLKSLVYLQRIHERCGILCTCSMIWEIHKKT